MKALPILLLFAAAAQAAAASSNACSAVTRTDVRQALGQYVGQGREQSEPAASTCDYAGARGQVTVTVQRLKGRLDLQAEMASLKASIPEAGVREAGGLGSRAFFLDIAGAGSQLFVIRDYDFVMISVLGFGEPAQVSAAAEAMARAALARLGDIDPASGA